MAIYHCAVKHVSRKTGRSAVAAAAYRDAAKYVDQRTGLTHDFTRKQGVGQRGVILPGGVNAEWAKDSEALWNGAEAAEKRKDFRTAREVEIAIPHELSEEQAIALVKEFCQQLADETGTAVTFAIHDPDRGNDVRNKHAHILQTVRKVGPVGLGEKAVFALSESELKARGLPSGRAQIEALRAMWEETANRHLAMAGHDVRIDRRSHSERGLEIEPTLHQGPKAAGMKKRGVDPDRVRMDAAAAARNAERIRKNPGDVLEIITAEKAVFDRRDVARTLSRYVTEPDQYVEALARVMGDERLVKLADDQGNELAKYSTKAMVQLEARMARYAQVMANDQGYPVSKRAAFRAELRQVERIRAAGGSGMDEEQRLALHYMLAPGSLKSVEGLPGTGKSATARAAREAWEEAGYRVRGAALSGMAAESLQEGSGIESRTLASLELSWKAGKDLLTRDDVLVIDEAGMLGSAQLERVLARAAATGAKVVLIHDREQTQAIAAGAGARVLHDQIGGVRLKEIKRQQKDWQRDASVKFGTGQTREGLAAYREQKRVLGYATTEEAKQQMIAAMLRVRETDPHKTVAAMAHTRRDVADLNAAMRAALKERGQLAGGRVCETRDGKREFAPGDQIMFRENNRTLGVKNGTLGVVKRAEAGRLVVVVGRREVVVDLKEYAALDHGYAATVHKHQGITADYAMGLATAGMDRHLMNVMATRHRTDFVLVYGRDEFSTFDDLATRLSRSNLKCSTLDFAERWGLTPERARAEAAREAARPAAEQATKQTHKSGLGWSL